MCCSDSSKHLAGSDYLCAFCIGKYCATDLKSFKQGEKDSEDKNKKKCGECRVKPKD